MEETVQNYNYNLAKKILEKAEQNPPKKYSKDLFLNGLHYTDCSENKLLYVSLYLTHKCQINCVYCSKHYEMQGKRPIRRCLPSAFRLYYNHCKSNSIRVFQVG